LTSLAILRRNLKKGRRFRLEYARLGPIFAIVEEMVEARQAAGLTQAEVALRMGTSQSAVARLEHTRHTPSFDIVARYAEAIGCRLDLRLIPER
jgi:ribosome-binding protein aMBF1 (putative translation factor)